MTQPKIYDSRAEAERLVTVDGLRVDWRDGDSAMCLFLEVPGLGDITAEDYAGGVRVNLATALTAAFAAGALSRDAEVQARDIAHALGFREGTTHGIGLGKASRDAEVEALRGALAEACDEIGGCAYCRKSTLARLRAVLGSKP